MIAMTILVPDLEVPELARFLAQLHHGEVTGDVSSACLQTSHTTPFVHTVALTRGSHTSQHPIRYDPRQRASQPVVAATSA
jgi:hypothetical protein